MVAVTQYHGLQIIAPVLFKQRTEIQAALAPFIIDLIDHQKAEFVTQVIQCLVMGIMTAADCIAAHSFQRCQPAAKDGLRNGSAKAYAAVVVKIGAVHFQIVAVQGKTGAAIEAKAAETDGLNRICAGEK